NLAAPSFVPASWDRPVQTAEFAAVGATSLLEAIRTVNPKIRFYQASSSEIFGEPHESPQTEQTPLAPLTPYGVAKAYAHFSARSCTLGCPGSVTCASIRRSNAVPPSSIGSSGTPRRRTRSSAGDLRSTSHNSYTCSWTPTWNGCVPAKPRLAWSGDETTDHR